MGDLRGIELARDGRITCRNHTRYGYERLARGIYRREVPTEPKAGWWALVRGVMTAYARTPVILCGPTALQVLGVALPTSLEDWRRCHVIAGSRCRPERTCVVTHRAVREPVAWRIVGGAPVCHPVDAWLELHGATDDELVEVGDGLLRRQRPLLTMGGLTSRLDELSGTTGVKRARRLVRLLRVGTDSPYETRTRLMLVRAGLPCPQVNLAVPCRSGMTYHVDLGYEIERVAVEYDGAVHVGDRRQMELDALRRRQLQDEGWMVINVTADQLRHPGDLLASIEQALILRRAAAARRS